MRLLAIAKISSRGLIRLPKVVMDELDLDVGDELLFFRDDGKIFIEKGPLIIKYAPDKRL
jgi:AbrB family looped-hinge helix DNA binding protein